MMNLPTMKLHRTQTTPPASPPIQILPLLSDIERLRVLRSKNDDPVKDAPKCTPIGASVQRDRSRCSWTPVSRNDARKIPLGCAQGSESKTLGTVAFRTEATTEECFAGGRR